MKHSREVWIYQHKQYIGKAHSVQEAAAMADTSSTTVNKIIKGTLGCTRDGYIFTDEPLTDEELEHAPDSNIDKPGLKRIGKKCIKEVRNQEYDVDCKNGLVGFIPAKKEERRAMLRKMVYLKLRDRWFLLPEKVATLERQVISELIDSL